MTKATHARDHTDTRSRSHTYMHISGARTHTHARSRGHTYIDTHQLPHAHTYTHMRARTHTITRLHAYTHTHTRERITMGTVFKGSTGETTLRLGEAHMGCPERIDTLNWTELGGANPPLLSCFTHIIRPALLRGMNIATARQKSVNENWQAEGREWGWEGTKARSTCAHQCICLMNT